MNSRLLEVEIGGRTVRTFSVEDTMVMLCVHGAKHFWERLAWIQDIANLVGAQPVDWRALTRIAGEMKCSRLLLLGLLLAHNLFDAPVPPEILERAQNDRNVRWLTQKVNEQYAGVADPGEGVLSRFAFRIRSRDAIGHGIFHILRLTIRPTETDREALRLPAFLSPLYALVRPWRLLREHGLGLKSRRRPAR